MDKIEPKYLQAIELIKKAIHPCAWKGHSGKYLDTLSTPTCSDADIQ